MKQSRSDRAIDFILYMIIVLIGFTMLYPFWNLFVVSLNEGLDTSRGGIVFWPRVPTLENYRYVFQDQRMGQAFRITVLRTVIGTFLSILATSIFSYGMSKNQLWGRKIYTWICIFTMYFSGGLIPYYILIRNLSLTNSFWVMVLPGIINVWNMIIFRSFFKNLPAELEESAKIDGAGYYRLFFKIIIPISAPVFATLTLFTAVNHWNSWFDAAIFINDSNLMPLQTLLRQIINSNSVSQMMREINSTAAEHLLRSQITSRSLSAATMMVATIPIVLVYPFLQKFFVKGVMIGSLKG